MNRKIRFLNLKSLKKRIWRCHVFYLNYEEVGKRRSSILGFLNDSLFHRWSCYLIFHSCQIVIHLCFARKALFQFFNSRLPQSFDQNTKQDKTLCLRVSSKNKENISLQSHLSLSLFLFKKCFRRLLKSGATEIEFKDSDFWCGKKSASMFFQRRYGRNRKSHLYISYQEINNCSL